jgi:DNA-binding transcriptional regulator YhcF (GntR family)
MDKALITELFGIDVNSTVPLRTQLIDRLENFINNSTPGTVIPPERLLAQSLGVSRVTVRNALAPFLENGSIIRHNHNGTTVAPKAPTNTIKINELATGLPWSFEQNNTLKFLCYETLPLQKIFWKKIVEYFNNVNNDCQIEIVWLDKLLKGKAILNFIKEHEIDIILHSSMYDVPLDLLATKLPSSLQKISTQNEYIFNDMHIENPQDFQYLLPFQLVYCKTFYNVQLAKKCNLAKVSEHIFENQKINLIAQALTKLPKDKFASSHIWCHLAYQGIVPEEENRQLLQDVLQSMYLVKDYKNSFMLNQDYPCDDVDKFIKGDILFFDGTFPQIQQIGNITFDCKQSISSQVAGSNKFGPAVCIAISSQCRNYEVATKFLNYLISKEVQKDIFEIKQEYPIIKSLFLNSITKQCELTNEQAMVILNKTSLFTNSSNTLMDVSLYYIFKCRNFLKEMMNSEISVEECTNKIIKNWYTFKQHLQR